MSQCLPGNLRFETTEALKKPGSKTLSATLQKSPIKAQISKLDKRRVVIGQRKTDIRHDKNCQHR